MTLIHALQVLIARWKIIAIAMILGITVAAAYSFIVSPTYKSAAAVLINVRAPETVGAQSVVDQLSPDYLLTQEDILKSTRVALQVVDMTGLGQSVAVARAFGWTPEAGSIADYLAKQLQSQLLIGSSAVNSRVISVGYVSSDPNFASQMANAFAEAYSAITIDLQAEPARRTVDSYNRQLAALSQQLTAAQAKLAAREKELGIVSTQNADADATRLDALSSQLAAAQAQDASIVGHSSAGTLPDAMASPVIQTLQSEIAKLEGQRQQLNTVAGPNNPDYQQLNNQIRALREQLTQQEALIQKSVSAASRQAGSAVSNLRSTVQAQRREVIAAHGARVEIAVLEQDVANLKTLYDQMQARRSQLKVLDDVGQTNVSILTRAIPSRHPMWPRKGLLLVLGLLGGFALGSFAAIAIEFGDRRLRQSEEFESWLGIHDLGAIRIGSGFRTRLPRPIAGLLPYIRA